MTCNPANLIVEKQCVVVHFFHFFPFFAICISSSFLLLFSSVHFHSFKRKYKTPVSFISSFLFIIKRRKEKRKKNERKSPFYFF